MAPPSLETIPVSFLDPFLGDEETINDQRVNQALDDLEQEFDEQNLDVPDNSPKLNDLTPETMNNILILYRSSVVGLVYKHYQNKGVDPDDLVQEGCLGLFRAAELFDPSRGNTFLTYAGWHIRHKITRAIANQALSVDLPVDFQAKARSLEKARLILQAKGTSVDLETLTEETGLSAEQIQDIDSTGRPPLRLDAPILPDSDESIGVFIRDRLSIDPAEAAINRITRESLLQAVNALPPLRQAIVDYAYGISDGCPLPGRRIGQLLGLTDSAVRSERQRAEWMLQHPSHPLMLQTAPPETEAFSSWRNAATCSGKLDLFFGLRHESAKLKQSNREKAKRICGSCAVRSQCATSATTNAVQDGIWGGQWIRGVSADNPKPVFSSTPDNTGTPQ